LTYIRGWEILHQEVTVSSTQRTLLSAFGSPIFERDFAIAVNWSVCLVSVVNWSSLLISELGRLLAVNWSVYLVSVVN
jgi:hypothetical protein